MASRKPGGNSSFTSDRAISEGRFIRNDRPDQKPSLIFPELPRETFHGLPGLLADSLPDELGNALIDAWLAIQGRSPDSLNAVERLCYMGSRGMGALEFFPSNGPRETASRKIEVHALVKLASDVLNQRSNLDTTFNDSESLREILRVGTSAGWG